MTYYLPSPSEDSTPPSNAGDHVAGTDAVAWNAFEACGPEPDAFGWDAAEWDAADPMTDDGEEYIALEHSELDRRLRNLAWPAPAPDVRQRCFEAVLRAGLLDSCPPAPPVFPKPPTGEPRLTESEHVQRYEVTRRRFEPPVLRIPAAPRRQPRFASVL